MSPELYALVQRIHGVVATLGLAVMLHPVIALWRGRRISRWTQLTADLGALLVVVPFTLGWWIYPVYRVYVKPDLLQHHLHVALRFESKEHLAAMCVALAVGGTLTLRFGGAESHRVAFWLLLLAWIAGVTTAVLGIYVSAIAQPGW